MESYITINIGARVYLNDNVATVYRGLIGTVASVGHGVGVLGHGGRHTLYNVHLDDPKEPRRNANGYAYNCKSLKVFASQIEFWQEMPHKELVTFINAEDTIDIIKLDRLTFPTRVLVCPHHKAAVNAGRWETPKFRVARNHHYRGQWLGIKQSYESIICPTCYQKLRDAGVAKERGVWEAVDRA